MSQLSEDSMPTLTPQSKDKPLKNVVIIVLPLNVVAIVMMGGKSAEEECLIDHIDMCLPREEWEGRDETMNRSEKKKDIRKGSARRKQVFPREPSPDIHAICFRAVSNARNDVSLLDVAFYNRISHMDYKHECIRIPSRTLNGTSGGKVDSKRKKQEANEDTVLKSKDETEVDVVSL